MKSVKITAPVIAECFMNIECKVIDQIVTGDHTVFVVEPVAAVMDEDVVAYGRFSEKYLDKSNQIHLGEIVTMWNMIKAIDHWARAHAGKPEDPEIMVYLSLGYDLVGQDDVARSLVEKCAKVDPINPLNEAIADWNHFFGGRYDFALDSLSAAYNLSPENPMHQYFKALILLYNDTADEAYDFICQNVEEPSENIWSQVRGEERFKKLMERVKYEWENFEV